MNNQNKKHHYRNVFKSDHLGSADLEDLIEQGYKLAFTIKEVRQEIGAKVAGKKMDANIAYFIEPIKPLVLNATNSKQVKLFAGTPFVEDWKNIAVELYVDENVRAITGGTTQGVRIKPVQPNLGVVKKPIFTQSNFEKAKKANATKEQIETIYELPNDTWLTYEIYASTSTT